MIGRWLSELAPRQLPREELAAPEDPYQVLGTALKFIFSSVAMTAIAVIYCGKWLGECLQVSKPHEALFRIPLPGVFRVEATGADVGLGLTGFGLTLLASAVAFGAAVDRFVAARMGLDLGQWNALCLTSSLGALTWSFLLFLLLRRPWGSDALVDEQMRRLEKLDEQS